MAGVPAHSETDSFSTAILIWRCSFLCKHSPSLAAPPHSCTHSLLLGATQVQLWHPTEAAVFARLTTAHNTLRPPLLLEPPLWPVCLTRTTTGVCKSQHSNLCGARRNPFLNDWCCLNSVVILFSPFLSFNDVLSLHLTWSLFVFVCF